MENLQGFRPAWSSLNRRNKIIILVVISMIACGCLGAGALMAPTKETPATKADIAKSVESTVSAMPTPEPLTIEKIVKEAASEADVARAVEATLAAMPTAQAEVTERIVEVTVIVAKEVVVTPTPKPAPAYEVYSVGDVIQVEDHTIVLNSADIQHAIITANFTVENLGTEEMTISSLLCFSAKGSDGTKLGIDFCSSGLDGTVLPGDKLKGNVCWKYPPGVEGVKVYYDASLFGKGTVVWGIF